MTDPVPIEQLREQAERETRAAATTRRPSWAPALVLQDELLDACRSLELLGAQDKPVARLWAIFADPKKLGTWQRGNLSEHPLAGHRVRGFELIAGEERSGPKRIYRTLKHERGFWGEDPNWWPPSREQLTSFRMTQECERNVHTYKHRLDERLLEMDGSDDGLTRFYQEQLTKYEALLASETGKLEAEFLKRTKRYELRKRSFDLARERFAEFLGNPETQMRAGSQVTRRCSRCGTPLTDPISIERGIGPECIKRVAWSEVVPDLKPRLRPAPIEDLFEAPGAVVAAEETDDDWMLPGE